MGWRVWFGTAVACAILMFWWLLYFYANPTIQSHPDTICVGSISAGAPSAEQQCITRPKP